MEHYDDTNTTPPASNGAGSNASNPPIPPDQSSSGDSSTHCGTASAQPWPNTAIERQIARDNYRKRTYRLTPDRPAPRRNHPNTTRRIFRPAFLASSLFVLLLVAAGMIFIANDRDHRVQHAVTQFLQNHFLEETKPTTPSSNSSLQNANALPPSTENSVAATSNAAAISVPISDISLRQPAFLEQLVQVYRTQLASNPNDSRALAALTQLQDRSLSELQTIVSQGDEETAKNSMSVAVRIFPELSSNTRYMYLVTRMDYFQNQPKDAVIAKTELSNTSPTTAAISATSATTAQTSPSSATTIPTEKVASASTPVSASPVTAPVTPAPVATVPTATAQAPTSAPKKIVTPIADSSAADSSPAVAKRTSANAVSLKPEIRAVSVTPGTMVDGQFVPSDEGNMFLVEIGYRNFDKAFGEKPEATLVTRLGVPGDSMVLAEIPLVITADRGTTSFLAETYVQSSRGGRLQLNFILNDEFLTSRTLRVSMPRRAAVEN